MSKDDLITCSEDEDVEVATQKMRDKQVRRLPVLNAERRLVGILALGDVAVDQGDDADSSNTLKEISRPS
jgi:CBS domain-containing protein